MLISVFSRHSSDCKYAADRTFRRCNCPKWIGGQVNREYFRKSAGTRLWNEAEEYRLKLEDALVKGLPPFGPEPESVLTPVSVSAPAARPALSVAPRPEEIKAAKPEKARVTIEVAVEAYLADARSRELESSTISKLETIFRKQLLAWTRVQGLDYLDQIDLDALLSFRSTWADGRLAKQKKQSRLIGFFWACVRRGYIAQNPSMGLGKIKVIQIPTDYFPRDEFQRIFEATYIYGDPRGGVIDVQAIRSRLRTMTLLMRWSGLRIRDAVTLERDRLHGDSLMTRRSPALLTGVFAAVALLLAAIGTYAVLSFAVSQRHREIGIRMALGALPQQVVDAFLGIGTRLLMFGVALGVVGALVAGRAMESVLFGVGSFQANVLAAASGVMMLVALLACYIPARRAARVDPMVALRCE